MKKTIYLLAAVLLSACGAAPTEAPELKVMSMNMRYDNPEDGENNWQYRRERIAAMVAGAGVDVMGTQELLGHQYAQLRELLPAYGSVGVGREDGTSGGEHCAIFYLKERFELLESGTFWLSEHPEEAGSKGWGGACERIATWAVLREKGGRELFFIDTHLDHVGRVARSEGVKLLFDRIATLGAGRPVVLTGDFNSDPDSPVIAHVLSDGSLRHARDIAAECRGAAWSFADFGQIPEERRPLIDYIFVSRDFEVPAYEILPDTFNGGYVSDHAPVTAVLKFADR